MDANYRSTLLELLNKRFDTSELRRASFALFGAGGYDNLSGSTVDERKTSFLETIIVRNLISEFAEYVREFIPDADLSFIAIGLGTKAEHQIEFVNRIHETSDLTTIACPQYLILNAPAGYGKTRLLKAVKENLQKQGWRCVGVTLEREKAYTLKELVELIWKDFGGEGGVEMQTPNQYGYSVATQILRDTSKVKTNGIIIIVDSAEVLSKDVIEQFFSEVIPGLQEGLRGTEFHNRLRLIVSGRYISEWEQYTGKLRLSVRDLSSFEFPVVQETVRLFMQESYPAIKAENQQAIASHIMYLTGGHPGCMVDILHNVDVGWPPNKFFREKGNLLYKAKVELVIDKDIIAHIPDSLKDVLESLSVVRRYTPNFLAQLIKEGLIKWNKDEFDLEEKLLATYLISRDSDGFLSDAITRRQLAIHLRLKDISTYIKISEQAISFYQDYLDDLSAYRPDIIAVELLLQKLQLYYYRDHCEKQRILEMIPDFTHTIFAKRGLEVFRGFVNSLRSDWEFRFLYNFLFQNQVYDEEMPYSELLENVASKLVS